MLNKPILLFGSPRSGTTWIGKIFDSHPDILYRHEPDSTRLIHKIPLLAEPGDNDGYKQDVQIFSDQLISLKDPKVCASLPAFRKSYYSPLHYRAFQASAYLAKAGSRVYRNFPVLPVKNLSDVPQLRIAWKSIEYVGAISLFLELIPESLGVQIIRHPCGYVASVLKGESSNRFTSSTKTAEDYGLFSLLVDSPSARKRNITLEDFKQLSPIERLAMQWMLFNEKSMMELTQYPRYYPLKYEDMTDDPVGTSKRLFEFAELDWNAQTEAFVSASTATENSAYYSVYKDPKAAARRWQSTLSGADIDSVLAIVKDSLPGNLFS